MRSSTSSSEPSVSRWMIAAPLAGALVVTFAVVLFMEWQLAARGFQVTVADDFERWGDERQRASRLGANAMVFVGSSRIQLAIDSTVVRSTTGKEPVMLATDGGVFLPGLMDLAEDPEVRGVVVVDFIERSIATTDSPSQTVLVDYVNKYRQHETVGARTFGRFDRWLRRLLVTELISFSDGARPVDSLTRRIINTNATAQYLVTFADRTRAADYSLTNMPAFYLLMVANDLHLSIPADPRINWVALEPELARRVAAVRELDAAHFHRADLRVQAAVDQIQNRGGRVILLRMPSCKLIREIERRQMPRERFWDAMAKTTRATAIHFEDHEELRNFRCPDGSHLDRRDRSEFTRRLMQQIQTNATDHNAVSAASESERLQVR